MSYNYNSQPQQPTNNPVNIAQDHPDFVWKSQSNGLIPELAVQGGCEADGAPLYIASLCVGKVGAHLGGCLIPYGGKEHFSKEYEVLCGQAKKLKWIECQGRCNLDLNKGTPLKAGFESNGNQLFVTKYRLNNGGEVIGKVGPHMDNGCMFGYDNKEHASGPTETYFVLGF